ncbi:tetratricopeptide repeat protein [Saccharothrix sp. AJ9571]|nr:tetratricopeptide repeat protein [Saccharothrix sp. AJ9571]
MTTQTTTGNTAAIPAGQYVRRLARRADAAADDGQLEDAERFGIAAFRSLRAARLTLAAGDRACWLGELYENSDRRDAALDAYRAALQLYRAAEEPIREAGALRRIGAVLLAAGRSQEALNALHTAHRRCIDHPALVTADAALVDLLLGYARWACGRPRLAAESFRAAAAAFAHTADPRAAPLQAALDQPQFQPPPAHLLGFPRIAPVPCGPGTQSVRALPSPS